MTPAGRAGAFLAQVSSSTITVCGDHKTVFSAALRGQKEAAVAVLRAPSWPFVDKKKLPLPSCSCRSPRPFVALRGQKEVAVAVLQLPFFVPLRGPSWTKRSCRCRPAVAVLRAPSRPFVDKKKLPLPSCCSCRSSCPFAALRGQKEVAVAVLQLPFFVPLRGPSWTKRSCRCRPAVAVLRAPSRPFVDKKKLPLPSCSCRSPRPFVALRGQKEVAVAVLQLPFFVPLRGPSWTKRICSCRCRCRPAVAVLRAPSRPFVDKKKLPLPFCSCRSPCPFAALRGQKEVAVAVLQLPFFVPLRGPSWTKRSCRCHSAVIVLVLRAPSRPFVDKKKLPLPSCSCRSPALPFFVPLRGPSWTKRSCRCRRSSCRSSCPFAALRGQKEVAVAVLQLPFSAPLRGPSWTKRSCRCRPALSWPFVTKRSCRHSAVIVLRAPSWIKKVFPTTLRGLTTIEHTNRICLSSYPKPKTDYQKRFNPDLNKRV